MFGCVLSTYFRQTYITMMLMMLICCHTSLTHTLILDAFNTNDCLHRLFRHLPLLIKSTSQNPILFCFIVSFHSYAQQFISFDSLRVTNPCSSHRMNIKQQFSATNVTRRLCYSNTSHNKIRASIITSSFYFYYTVSILGYTQRETANFSDVFWQTVDWFDTQAREMRVFQIRRQSVRKRRRSFPFRVTRSAAAEKNALAPIFWIFNFLILIAASSK